MEKFTTSTDTLGREQPRTRKPLSQFIMPQAPEIKRPFVVNNSGNNEWYTPRGYIEAARRVMGSIDIDPASTEAANEVVQAKTYYTKETDGLSQIWSGNVWLNPPYAGDLIVKFISKLEEELSRIRQAIVLVNNATETEWFNRLVRMSSEVCFPRGRLKFYNPEGQIGAPLQGQALLYIGEGYNKFRKEYEVFGWCGHLR